MKLVQQLREMRTVVDKRKREVLGGWIAKWAVLLTKINRQVAELADEPHE